MDVVMEDSGVYSDPPACVAIPRSSLTMQFFSYCLSAEASGKDPSLEWRLLDDEKRKRTLEHYDEWMPEYMHVVPTKVYERMSKCGAWMDVRFLRLPPDCQGVVVVAPPYHNVVKFYPYYPHVSYERMITGVTVTRLQEEAREKARLVASGYDPNGEFYEMYRSRLHKPLMRVDHQEICEVLFLAQKLVARGEPGKKRPFSDDTRSNKRQKVV